MSSNSLECPICGDTFESPASLGGHKSHHDTSEDDIVKEIQEVAKDLGRAPTFTEIIEQTSYGQWAIEERYGSVRSAREAAGVGHPEKTGPQIPEEELRKELRRLDEEVEGHPTQREMWRNGEYSAKAYRTKWGSWNNALNEVLGDVNYQRNVSKSDLLKEIQRIADIVGRAPSVTDIREHSKYSVGVYQSQFGSWAEARTEAGFPAILSGRHHPNWKGGPKNYYYGPNWSKQREKCRARDDYKCQSCGISEEQYKEQTGQELEVHHKKPVREFYHEEGNADFEAMNQLSNLITLCKSCHSRIEPR